MSTGIHRTSCRGLTRSVNGCNMLWVQLCSLLTERWLNQTLGCVMFAVVTRHCGVVRSLVALSELLVVGSGRVCGWRSWYVGTGLMTERRVSASLYTVYFCGLAF